MSELNQRVISAVVMAAVFLGAVYFGGTVFTLLMAVVAAVIWAEWSIMKLSIVDDRISFIGYSGIALCALALLFLSGTVLLGALTIVFAGIVTTLIILRGSVRTVFGFLYAGLFLVSMVMLRGEMGFLPGLIAILFLCAVVWFTDIGAYFAGRAIGGPKLAPAVSPNKTISGALGGVACAMIGGGIIIGVFGIGAPLGYFLLAAVLSVLSQCGDLFESAMKRRSGVKDSGTFIPGHGGAMDRVDGLVFASIFLWLTATFAHGFSDPATAFFG